MDSTISNRGSAEAGGGPAGAARRVPSPRTKRGTIQSVDRAARILKALAAGPAASA